MAPNSQLPVNYTSKYFSSIGKQLYLNEERADVHFVFDDDDGQSTRIPSHKILLTVANEVFRTMFNGSWDENSEVKIVDASEEGFKEFLQFFYFTDIVLTMDNIAELIYLGKKYNVAECLELCTKFLRNMLNEGNTCFGYRLAIDYEQEGLKNFCETMIMLNTKAIFESVSFLQCDQKILSHIVKLNSMSCTESELFEACMRRADVAAKESLSNQNASQIEIRSLLKDFRFGTLSLEELTTLSSSHHNQFSYDEYREIVNMISSNEFQPTLLNGVREKRIDAPSYNEFPFVYCDRLRSLYGSVKRYYIKDIETTLFSTNQPILLKEIIFVKFYRFLNKYIELENDVPTEVTIVEVSGPTNSSDEIILYNEHTNLQSNQHTSIFLSKPILIKSGFMYEIRMKQSPPEDCCTAALLDSEVQIQPDLIVQFHNVSKTGDDKTARGFVKILKFIEI